MSNTDDKAPKVYNVETSDGGRVTLVDYDNLENAMSRLATELMEKTAELKRLQSENEQLRAALRLYNPDMSDADWDKYYADRQKRRACGKKGGGG